MPAITFDALKFVRRLRDAGVSEKHAEADAEALAEVFSEALETQLATKADMVRLEGELKLLRWMVGLVIGGVAVLILKTFFNSAGLRIAMTFVVPGEVLESNATQAAGNRASRVYDLDADPKILSRLDGQEEMRLVFSGKGLDL